MSQQAPRVKPRPVHAHAVKAHGLPVDVAAHLHTTLRSTNRKASFHQHLRYWTNVSAAKLPHQIIRDYREVLDMDNQVSYIIICPTLGQDTVLILPRRDQRKILSHSKSSLNVESGLHLTFARQ
jgi:hypothetical protein